MTLVIGMYYDNKKGALIATDSRMVADFEIFPPVQKIFKIENSVFAFAGVVSLRDEIIENLRSRLKDEEVREKILEIYTEIRDKYTTGDNPAFTKNGFLCQTMFSFYKEDRPYLAATDDKGIIDPFYNGFATMGQDGYVKIILRQIYQESLSKQQAINIAAYSISETAKINSGVDENIQLAIIDEKGTNIFNYENGKFNFQRPEFEEVKKRMKSAAEWQRIALNTLVNGKEEDRSRLEKLLGEVNSQ
ncbi:MAG: hypothetical protein AABX99_03235 [Nanoarchaeota archaeon]